MSIKGLIDDLVSANHILYKEGVVDGFGHVSVRDERNPERFLLARSIAPATVSARDVMEFGIDGEPLNPRGRKPYLERYIHSEIYRARPDVVAIVHSHSPALIPFGITGTSLKPVYHMSGFLGSATPIFEIRDAGGPATDMLIRDRKLGAALARTLGAAPFALMRGHGSVAVGGDVEAGGLPRDLRGSERAPAGRGHAARHGHLPERRRRPPNASRTNDGVIDRPWALWKNSVKSA